MAAGRPNLAGYYYDPAAPFDSLNDAHIQYCHEAGRDPFRVPSDQKACAHPECGAVPFWVGTYGFEGRDYVAAPGPRICRRQRCLGTHGSYCTRLRESGYKLCHECLDGVALRAHRDRGGVLRRMVAAARRECKDENKKHLVAPKRAEYLDFVALEANCTFDRLAAEYPAVFSPWAADPE